VALDLDPIASAGTEHRRFPAELAGVVTALGYGTTGCRWDSGCSALTDSYRGGGLAEYVAIRGSQPRPAAGDVDFTAGASLPMPGLTAWQGLFEHGRLQAGQSVLVHGAAGSVGSMVTQLASEAGAYVIGTGHAADRQRTLDFGAMEFVDIDNDALDDVGGRQPGVRCHRRRHPEAVRRLDPGRGRWWTIAGPSEARPADGLAIDFVVASDRAPTGRGRAAGPGRTAGGRTSATSRPSTTPSPPSTRPSGSAGRRSSALVRERHAPINAPKRQMTHD